MYCNHNIRSTVAAQSTDKYIYSGHLHSPTFFIAVVWAYFQILDFSV